jgi:hypothetical protein
VWRNLARFAGTNLRTTREDLLKALLEFREVRPRPVNLTATSATPEFFVIHFGERLQFVDYFGLWRLFQQRVTSQAPCERRDRFRKVKAADNFDRLFIGILGARIISVTDDRVHEETAITRQKRSIFADHYVE